MPIKPSQGGTIAGMRLTRWLAGMVGIAALARLLAGRKRRAEPDAEAPAGADPADELRRKLDEVRSGSTGQAADAASPAESEAPTERDAATPTLEERRAAIHARAQEAIDSMREVDE